MKKLDIVKIYSINELEQARHLVWQLVVGFRGMEDLAKRHGFVGILDDLPSDKDEADEWGFTLITKRNLNLICEENSYPQCYYIAEIGLVEE